MATHGASTIRSNRLTNGHLLRQCSLYMRSPSPSNREKARRGREWAGERVTISLRRLRPRHFPKMRPETSSYKLVSLRIAVASGVD